MKYGVQVLQDWVKEGKKEISWFKKERMEWMELWVEQELGAEVWRGGGGHKNLQMQWLCSMSVAFPHGVIIWKVQTYTSSQWRFPQSEPEEHEPIFQLQQHCAHSTR